FRGEIWWVIGAPLAVYFIGQALDDYVWTPLIQGKSTGMDTPTILFATLAGGALLGIYGLLLAIPLAACIKILLQEIFWPRFKQWSKGETPDFLPIPKE
ncbi:MAG: AI-2E family transporter, partial [Planctomycetota bacterium]